MSRVELDESERGVVRRARQALDKAEADGVAGRTDMELCGTIGSLRYQLGALLKLLEGGEER